ncbi:hypothetical protein BT96DRAFT_111775 [Gymnopus androsaceus JB14]|uniref:3-beta hydroxysteroid dehydrogenase/isomerase domain-containing protein n=1 Tax=Gymnopus androsaceus JB14 TaxID=1447944 RepID=A0A6A4HDM4_9AGAR|nr:hypothetical protein BT96DRAFT_111775 [Gymnopus androsaceus JB14]
MASLLAILVYTVFFTIIGTVWYCSVNNAALSRIPPRILELSPVRWGKADFQAVAKKVDESPVVIEEHLPPKTGRKYIVVGGSGFLGGWIIIHLLKRAKEVQFVPADISKSEQVEAAFKAPWPNASSSTAEITVFHSAAIIRFYERHPSVLPLSKLNVVGTEHVINASRAIGASILIFTSSGSVAQRNTRLLLIPVVGEGTKDILCRS